MTTPAHLALISGSLSAALLFLFVLMAAGARLRGLVRLPLPADLKSPCEFLLGSWMYGMLALLAGLSGLFRRPVLLGLVVVLAVTGRRRGAGRRLKSLLPSLMACTALLPVALARPFFYDALVYHLALPWQSLTEGRIAAHGEDLFSSFPPLAQLVFAAPIAAGLDRAAALVHLGSFVLAGAAVASLARQFGASRGWARWAGALLPLLPAVVLVAGVPAAEGFAITGVVASLAITLRGARLRRQGALAAAAASGFLAGIATAARLQGLPWTIILLILLSIGPPPRARRLLAAVSGWVAGSAPWWLKNLILLHDPVAPIGWRRPGIDTLWRDSRGLMHGPVVVGDAVPALWEAVRPHLAYVAPLVLAAILAVAATRGRKPGRPGGRGPGTLLLAAGLGTAAWWLTGSLPRFWTLSLALLLALAAAATVTRAGRWAGGLAIVATGLLGLAMTAREVGRIGGLRLIAAGDAAARSLIVNSPLPAFEAAARLPDDVPSSGGLDRNALVLFVAEARSYRFPHRCLVPSQHDVSPLRELVETSADSVAVRDRLLERGITHLLINRSEMARLADSYPVLPWATPEGRKRFQDLLNLCGAPIVKEGETAIFALR